MAKRKQRWLWALALMQLLITVFLPVVSVKAQTAEYSFVDAGTITGPRGSLILNEAESPPGYYLSTETTCKDYIPSSSISSDISAEGTVTATLIWRAPSEVSSNCLEGNNETIIIDNVDARDTPVGEGDDGTSVPNCVSQGGEAAWAVCPVMNLLLGAIQGVSNIMSGLLQTRPLVADPTDAVFQIWSNMRNIALGFLVIAVLVAIFGQALSLNIDAYTMKKMLPRITIASVAIMLSYYIAAFLIDIFNVLGNGIQALVYSAIGDLDIRQTGGGAIAEDIIAVMGIGGAAVIAFGPATLATVGLILLPVVLAFMTALAVVVLRQVVIIALIILAPIAFVAWILPNTEQYFKKWYNTFSTLLMMYPLIMLLLSAGTVFAVVLTNQGSLADPDIINNNFINYVLALLALGVTMAAIPFTMRAASSVLSAVAGRLNDPNRGLIDRTRKGLQARKDFGREARKGERLNELGELNKKPGEHSFRKGWLRATTGTVGYGRNYKKLQQAESVTGARTVDERTALAISKAEQERAQIADFQLQNKMAEWNAQGMDRDGVAENLRQIGNKDLTSAESMAAVRAIMTQRFVPQLEAIFDRAAGGTDAERTALDAFKQQNFGTIDSFAAHLSRGSYGTNERGELAYNKAYSQLGTLNPEQFATQKATGVVGAIEHAIETGDEQLISNMVTSYAGTAPHQRTVEMTKIMSDAAAGYVQTKIPSEGNKLVPAHIEIPQEYRASSAAVDSFKQNVIGGKPPTFTPAQGSIKHEVPVSSKAVFEINPTPTGNVSTAGSGEQFVDLGGASVGAPQRLPIQTTSGGARFIRHPAAEGLPERDVAIVERSAIDWDAGEVTVGGNKASIIQTPDGRSVMRFTEDLPDLEFMVSEERGGETNIYRARRSASVTQETIGAEEVRPRLEKRRASLQPSEPTTGRHLNQQSGESSGRRLNENASLPDTESEGRRRQETAQPGDTINPEGQADNEDNQ